MTPEERMRLQSAGELPMYKARDGKEYPTWEEVIEANRRYLSLHFPYHPKKDLIKYSFIPPKLTEKDFFITGELKPKGKEWDEEGLKMLLEAERLRKPKSLC